VNKASFLRQPFSVRRGVPQRTAGRVDDDAAYVHENRQRKAVKGVDFARTADIRTKLHRDIRQGF